MIDTPAGTMDAAERASREYVEACELVARARVRAIEDESDIRGDKLYRAHVRQNVAWAKFDALTIKLSEMGLMDVAFNLLSTTQHNATLAQSRAFDRGMGVARRIGRDVA